MRLGVTHCAADFYEYFVSHWATFSATLHYHNRILASARKQGTKKSPKIDPCSPADPIQNKTKNEIR